RAYVLRDAARLARRDVCGAYAVEQRGLAVVNVSHDGDDGRARLLRVVGVGLYQLLELLFGDHLLEAEELHVEAEASAQLLRDVVVERLVERGEDAALQKHRLNVLGAYAELVGELLDGRALDETHLLEVARAS